MNRILALLLALTACPWLHGQDIEFFREDLIFRLDTSTFEVSGDYYFRNRSGREVRKMLFYPFPDTEKYGGVTNLHIRIKGDTNSQVATVSAYGALFKLALGANEEAVYVIGYVQKLETEEARYIITTTRLWGRALEQADYRLELDGDRNIGQFSIMPDSVATSGKSKTYYWKRKNFMPEEDFIFGLSGNGG